jgi:hypothetical protein
LYTPLLCSALLCSPLFSLFLRFSLVLLLDNSEITLNTFRDLLL